MNAEKTWDVVGALQLELSLTGVLPKSGPLLRVDKGSITYSLATTEGPAVVNLTQSKNTIRAVATGPGGAEALETVPQTVGLDDDPSSFSPQPGLVRDIHRRHPGLRLGATGRVFDAIVPIVIGQRVTTDEAHRSYNRLVRLVGEPAPGDVDMLLPPSPASLLAMDLDDFHSIGIERSRARILREVARRAGRLEEILTMDQGPAKERLEAVRGVGPWTSAQVMGVAWGDRDAIPIGDFHIPDTVAWALAGEPRGTDERMLELLEPYRPQRRRALTLIKLSGMAAVDRR